MSSGFLPAGIEPSAIFAGSAAASAVYLGSTKLWGGETPSYNFILLLNGITETFTPSVGSLGSTKTDSSCPVSVPVYYNLNMSNGVDFRQTEIANFFSDSTKSFTIDLWVKPCPTKTGYNLEHYLFGIYNNDRSNTLFDVQLYFFSYGGTFKFEVNSNSISSDYPVDSWHHLAFTKESNAEKIKIYIDGKYIGTQSVRSYSVTEFRVRGNTGNDVDYSSHEIAQIAVREGVVWDSDFTPPTNIYKQA